jgi:hypothetical protein
MKAKPESAGESGVSLPVNHDPRKDPQRGDVLLMRWGATATVVRRTERAVWVQYSDMPGHTQQYGVPNSWSSEISVGADIGSACLRRVGCAAGPLEAVEAEEKWRS